MHGNFFRVGQAQNYKLPLFSQGQWPPHRFAPLTDKYVVQGRLVLVFLSSLSTLPIPTCLNKPPTTTKRFFSTSNYYHLQLLSQCSAFLTVVDKA